MGDSGWILTRQIERLNSIGSEPSTIVSQVIPEPTTTQLRRVNRQFLCFFSLLCSSVCLEAHGTIAFDTHTPRPYLFSFVVVLIVIFLQTTLGPQIDHYDYL